ncbi:DJ-1/PfpI family protein [Candidatus Micrarchaeota archaeon]|nr:DJ-1/PfpI family protein [Candidatus Micrarchaeota archaeon]MBU1939617.1 DJ-1/PfpI family protein [Candidatus Micrarchaeota archaeon]
MTAEGKKVLFVIAPEDFRDEELFHPKEELRNAGAVCTIVSTNEGECTGSQGGTLTAEFSIDNPVCGAENFDAIVFVGGAGASIYFGNARAHELAKAYANAGKVVAAICIAPSILANAGLLNGKKATCYPSQKENLEAKGAQFTGAGVEADGRIVTADGPQSAREFGKRIAELI